jgi:NADH-quinone oxidoreductase subunit F
LGIQSKSETHLSVRNAASWPVAAAIRHFREEFEYHVRPERRIKRDLFAEPFEKFKHISKKNSLKMFKV